MQEVVGEDVGKLLTFLKESRGFDFTGYKRPSLQRRIAKRMQLKHIASYDDYIEYLKAHEDEYRHLFDTILINVTSFFRDPEAWEYVANTTLPVLLSSKKDGDPIRVWSAGCASGEEAYTVAMLLAERLGPEEFRDKVKIYATDLDEGALNQSRAATYTEKQVENVPPELLAKYFEASAKHYMFDREIRRAVIFGRHDLTQDAPISRVDLLICRNTLMYFNTAAQERILARFFFSLAPNGLLFLGKGETLLSQGDRFVPVEMKYRVFSKSPNPGRKQRGAGIPGPDSSVGAVLDGHVRLREAILDLSPMAQIVVDANGRLSLCNEKCRQMFGLARRDVGRPIQDLDISFRPVEMRSGIEQAIAHRRVMEFKEIPWLNAAGESMVLDLKISPMFDDGHLQGVLITWEDVTHFKRLQDELVNFNQELETAYEELQSTNEELQTTNEELQSTVEELETTNEELQSSNEELETMNEELQSTNEELETINDELRVVSKELNETNAFLNTVLAGFEEAVIVVDSDMQILAWNPRAHELWGLRSEEVVGKHVLNLDIGLPIEKLRPVIKASLAGKGHNEKTVVKALNRRGKSIECEVSVMPLPASNGELRGAILVIGDKPLEDLGGSHPAHRR